MWILNCGNRFAIGIFESKKEAEYAIEKYKLSGILTFYPKNKLIYDWAIENNFFTPKGEKQSTQDYIENFTSAYQEHYHYENGLEC